MQLTTPQAQANEAADFLEAWHGRDTGLVAIVAMRPGKHSALRPLVDEVGRHIGRLRSDGLDGLIYAEGGIWNIYHGASRLREAPPPGKRGGRKFVADAPGIWLDIDVKGDGLETYEDAWALCWALPARPSIIVGTGTGGLHPYWKTTRPLAVAELEELNDAWRATAELVCGRNLDRVSNCDRVLRTPGSVRWPKEGEQVTLARLLHVDGRLHDPGTLREAAFPAYHGQLRLRAETRSRLQRGGSAAEAALLAQNPDHPWLRLLAVAQLEAWFNRTYGWRGVLEPLGWEVEGEDPDGRVIWSRPGSRSHRSATTDWPEAPDSMSLLTRAPETGLLELNDAGVSLSKYRVYCELWWGGDEAAMVEELMREMARG